MYNAFYISSIQKYEKDLSSKFIFKAVKRKVSNI